MTKFTKSIRIILNGNTFDFTTSIFGGVLYVSVNGSAKDSACFGGRLGVTGQIETLSATFETSCSRWVKNYNKRQ